MSLLNQIEHISFKKIFWLALVVGVLFTIPLTVYLIQTETKLFSLADFTPPPMPELKRGPQPNMPPEITSVTPFLGKEGDIVIVNGKNFGFYPREAFLKIGSSTVPTDHLVAWEDNKISFYIPTAAGSGRISLSTGRFSTNWPQILTVYAPDNTTKVSRGTNSLLITNARQVNRVVYYGADGRRYEELLAYPITNADDPVELISELKTKNISWLTLFNPQNVVVPFHVSPIDFGF